MDKLVYYYTQNNDYIYYHEIIAIVMTLYLFRMHLYAVNADNVDAEISAVYI